ncbi:ABC transporter substrate-binding protein [Nocardia higoensis]|uniref:ABC transporter substrate-binding protein n=1 Tax=Nocardia higoensis TaxID=228599 RepID=UPI0009FEC2B8|nr:extracellular solute-binding protein [Nocardia higoensis]
MNLRKYLAGMAVASMFLVGACGGSDETASFTEINSMPELYEAAKAEGQLMIYGPTENLYAAVYEDFEKEYPGIDITTADIFGQELDTRLEGEQIAGGFEADLLHIGVSDMERYLEKDYLASYRPLGTESLSEDFVGPDETWSVASRHLYASVYNTSQIQPADLPHQWSQLTDPRWKGEVAVSNPKISGATPQALSAALEAGVIDEAWIDEFKSAVNPTIYPSVANALQSVVTGEQGLSLVAGYGTFKRQIQQGAPLGFAVMDDGAYFSDVAYGLLSGSKHSAAARLLTSWMFSPQGQASIAKHVYEFGTMPDAPAPDGADQLGISAEITYPGADRYKATLRLLGDKF